MMRAVRGKNTKPELIVRRLAHTMGFRFRLHRRDLPGTPDLVFPRLRGVILVHGCFWHRHRGCRGATTPKDNSEFWAAKFRRNIERDRAAIRALRDQGWRVIVIWECQTRDAQRLRLTLKGFLEEGAKSPNRRRSHLSKIRMANGPQTDRFSLSSGVRRSIQPRPRRQEC